MLASRLKRVTYACRGCSGGLSDQPLGDSDASCLSSSLAQKTCHLTHTHIIASLDTLSLSVSLSFVLKCRGHSSGFSFIQHLEKKPTLTWQQKEKKKTFKCFKHGQL